MYYLAGVVFIVFLFIIGCGWGAFIASISKNEFPGTTWSDRFFFWPRYWYLSYKNAKERTSAKK